MKKMLAGLLVLLVLVSSLIVFIPVYLIRPFVPQTASDLGVSYALRSREPASDPGGAGSGRCSAPIPSGNPQRAAFAELAWQSRGSC